MESETISLVIIIISIIMSAYFSATETAFSSFNRIRVKTMAEKGNKRARLVMRLSENYDSLLSTILIGNNIVNIASASLATVLFVKLLGNEIGPGVSTVVTTIVVLVFGEVSPKSIAKESPEKFAMFSAPFLNVFIILLTPFNFLFRQWKKLLSTLIKSTAESGITEEELLSIAYSRLPIFEDTIDHIIGIIYQKDFYNNVYHANKEISEIIRPALFVPKNKKLGALLKELQQKKIHIAVVLDEYGGTVGIITLEDILEELVGEIWDEYDEVSPEIEKASEAEYIVSGSANIDKVFELLDIKTDDEEIQSGIVNGWIMSALGKVPEKDDSFEYKGYRITVLEMDEKRVEKVLFTPKRSAV